MPIKKVALVGANGSLGSKILDALVSSNFDVRVLQRASSTTIPAHESVVEIRKVPDDFPVAEVTQALAGQDAVIACFPVQDPEQHIRIAEAAAAAGVRRYMPSDFGSVNADDRRAQELVPLYRNKTRVLDAVKRLAQGSSSSSFTWTSLVCGHFFDVALVQGWLHFDLKTKTADLLDGGSYPASASTVHRIAEAVVRVLEREEETANKMLYVQSFCVSQQDIVCALERATGEKWRMRRVISDMFVRVETAKLAAGHKSAVEELVWVLGTKGADWTKKGEFANGLLGLEDEDLYEVVARVVKSQG